MTREMAIQVLQTALRAPFIYGEYAEAIDMAIEALQVKAEGDPISRQEAIDCVRWGDSVTNVIDRIKALPSADRPIGRWIPVTKVYKPKDNEFPDMYIEEWEDAVEPDEIDAVKCSDCGEVFDFADARNWCTQCGAKMEGGEEE